MEFTNFLKINQRQNRALIYQLIVIPVSWICCYLTNFAFGVFMLTEMLVAGALAYSNEEFLKYNLKRSILIIVGVIALFSVFQFLMQYILIWIQIWIEFVSVDPIVLSSVSSYILVTVVLIITQHQIKIRLQQLLIAVVLLLVYFMFFCNNPAFGYSLKGYYVPFFINQFFVSIYAVSMMNSVKQEMIGVEAIETDLVSASSQTQKIYKFVKFTLFTLLGAEILFLLFIFMITWMLSGVNFDR